MKTSFKKIILLALALAVSSSAHAMTLRNHEFEHQNSWLQDSDSKLIYSIDGDVFRFTGLTPNGRDCATMVYKGPALMDIDSYFAALYDADNTLHISCETFEKVDHVSTDIYVSLKAALENQSKVFLLDHNPPVPNKNNSLDIDDSSNPFKRDPNEKSYLLTPQGIVPNVDIPESRINNPKIELIKAPFLSSLFFSPTWRTSQHHWQAVMISDGSHVIDIALTTKYKNMIMYRPFTVGFSRDANENAPFYHEIFVGAGCVTNLSVGTTIYSNPTYVTIRPVADSISKDNLYRAHGQYTHSRNHVPRNCYHANNVKH